MLSEKCAQMCTEKARNHLEDHGRAWKSQDASHCQPGSQRFSKTYRMEMEGAPEPCHGKPRWGSSGLIRPNINGQPSAIPVNTSKTLQNAAAVPRGSQRGPREGPRRAQGGPPARAQGGPREGPERAQGRSREGPGKTQGGGPGQGPERAQARRGAQSGRGQGGGDKAHLTPRTADLR